MFNLYEIKLEGVKYIRLTNKLTNKLFVLDYRSICLTIDNFNC